jgi:hypothetical protein
LRFLISARKASTFSEDTLGALAMVVADGVGAGGVNEGFAAEGRANGEAMAGCSDSVSVMASLAGSLIVFSAG